MDLHISVIADFKNLCPEVEVVDWCLSGHAWVMNRAQDYPDHINPATWKDLTPDRIAKFQARYDSFLSQFDGFIVAFASSFAMIFEKYNKPILMMNAVRYDIPFCFTKNHVMANKWHECMDRLNSKGLLTIVSNNRADQEYTFKGAGIRPYYIPSACRYTNAVYTPTKSTFLCTHGSLPPHSLVTMKNELPPRHAWSDVAQFKGIICFPYDTSLMSMFEYFFQGSPLFFPSKTYWKAHPDIISVSAYWADQLPSYLSEFKDLDKWIELSDVYEAFASPNTYYFDSIPHLFELLESFEYIDDRAFRQAKINEIKSQWKDILHRMMCNKFYTMSPPILSYNRLPLLANAVFDILYQGLGVTPLHSYPIKSNFTQGDIVFVKGDFIGRFLDTGMITCPITLVTGVSDKSPTNEECRRIIANPNITRWIGTNILRSDPKIVKIPIGVGERERVHGNYDLIKSLHEQRVPWEDKIDDVCVPHHTNAYRSTSSPSTLPKLEYAEYMREISKHRFVVCHRGNGVDTHRVCETLLMGSVPVLEHSGLDDMYSEWPCLIVDSFDSIDTSEFDWDDDKYDAFLDTIWLRDGFRRKLIG